MTDEARPVAAECSVAKNMIDVHMSVDHITNGKRGVLAKCGPQRAPDAHRPAGIDDRDALLTDDKAYVGSVVVAG